jgi:hypothetical protein
VEGYVKASTSEALENKSLVLEFRTVQVMPRLSSRLLLWRVDSTDSKVCWYIAVDMNSITQCPFSILGHEVAMSIYHRSVCESIFNRIRRSKLTSASPNDCMQIDRSKNTSQIGDGALQGTLYKTYGIHSKFDKNPLFCTIARCIQFKS